MIFCILGVTGELIGELNNDWSINNWQHLIIWGGFCMCGLIEFLHVYNVLSEPFWCVVPPIGMCYIGIMLTVHEQFLVFWRYLHLFSGLVTFPIVILMIVIPVRAIGRYNDKKEKQKYRTPSSEDGDEYKSRRYGWMFWRGRTLDSLNPAYTDQSSYSTIYPGLAAFFLCLESMLWFEMAFRMGWWAADNIPPEIHHAEHAFLAMFIGDVIMSVILFAVVSFICHFIDRRYKGGYSPHIADIEI